MSYIDAGYVVSLSVMFLFSLRLWAKRRRIERALGEVSNDAS